MLLVRALVSMVAQLVKNLPAMQENMKVMSLSRVRLFATPEHQAPPSMGFSRQEYRGGYPGSIPQSGTSAGEGIDYPI